jgi:lysozyme
MVNNLRDQLKRDEGQKLYVYKDSLGILTAGVGHNCESHNEGLELGQIISQEQSDIWLDQDIQAATDSLIKALPWIQSLDEVRKAVLQNMCFNMGVGKLTLFHQTLEAARTGRYSDAAVLMLQSKWALQVGTRATRLSTQMSTGIWQ